MKKDIKISINSLQWSNTNPVIASSHKKVYDHFGIPVSYTTQNINHGQWMTDMCRTSSADLLLFVDTDCVPIKKDIFDEAVAYCSNSGAFIGPAQASNHYGPPIPQHIFASPAFFMISKEAYLKMDSPSFVSVEGRSDVAQEVSRLADSLGVPYHCWYPICYENGPRTCNPLGYDKLGNYGRYGIGSVYANTQLYHLYEGSSSRNVDLFKRRCDEIVDGSFTTDGMRSSFYPLV